MKTIIQALLVFSISAFSFSNAFAQDQDRPSIYHAVDYMKVKPGMYDEYIACEKAWKKIHAAKKAAGMLDDWALISVLSPSGANVEYDFVTRNQFNGDEKLAAYFEGPFFPKDWESLLTEEERDLVSRTEEFRTLVKTEVWVTVEAIFSDDMSGNNVHVFNFFDHPEGKGRSDHFKVERDYWMPVHQARVNDGKMKGWVLAAMIMPAGSSMPYHDATVDIYADMSAMMSDPVEEYFNKMHGDNTEAYYDESMESTDLTRREIRIEIDGL